MLRRGKKAEADTAESARDDSAEQIDFTTVPADALRDRLAARSDGRDDRVVAAAADLRASLDRLSAGVAARREALTVRAGEIARAVAPYAGGAVAAAVGAVVVTRWARRPQVA